MRWSRAAASLVRLVMAAAGWAAEDKAGVPERARLGGFIPAVPPLPALERMQARLGDKITVVAISEDRGGSKAVEPFIGKLGLQSVKTYLDPKSAVERAFEVQGLPTSFLIDRKGRVLGRVEGAAEWDSPKLLETLESFLGGDETIKASFRRARP